MGKYHDYYDLYNIGKKDYAGEIGRIKILHNRYCQLPLDNVLEIGCGTGNHTMHLCKIAKRVIAYDIDEEMIAVARKKNSENNITFCCDNLSDIEGDHFSLCVMLGNVIHYLHDIKTVLEYFKAVSGKMLPGGLFVFDLWNGIAAIRNIPTENTFEVIKGDLKIVYTSNKSTSLMTQKTKLTNTIDIYKNEKPVDSLTYVIDHYLWTPDTLSKLLRLNGFEDIKITRWDDYEAAANEEDWKIAIVARRR